MIVTETGKSEAFHDTKEDLQVSFDKVTCLALNDRAQDGMNRLHLHDGGEN